MEITTEILINGIFSILLVIVFVYVGLKILFKYKVFKKRVFFLTGFAWIGISEPWWPSAIGFLMLLFTGSGLTVEVYLILNNAFLPIFLISWLMAISEMVKIKRKTLFIMLYLVIALILEGIMIYYLFTDVSKVGVMVSPVDVDFGIIAILHIAFNLCVFMISGFLFSFKTLKLNDPENKLRGKFLILAFILFLIGAILEIVITLPPNRIIILLCAIIFYIGFMMPEGIKNRLL
ncbi:MAG: hypothetical protein ACFFHV_16320 [Promethearchaeota archaeon]